MEGSYSGGGYSWAGGLACCWLFTGAGHGAAEMALLLLFTTKETMDAVRRSTVKLAGRTYCHQGEERWCSTSRAVMGRNQKREGKGFWLLSLFEGFNLIKNI
jgi:hypothetical protein